MDGFGSGERSYAGERKMEIVSGKGFGVRGNQIHATRSQSPDLPPIPTHGASLPWGFSDRKKRIAKYKVYTVEGKVKASLKRGLRWIKNKCSLIVHQY